MSILRAFKFEKYFNFRKSYNDTLCKRSATTDAKIQTNILHTERSKVAIVVPSVKENVSEMKLVPPMIATNSLLIKPKTLLPVVEKDVLSTSVSFDEVPGPKLLQHVAKIWSFVPIISNQVTRSTIQYMLGANKLLGSQLTWGRNATMFRWLLNEYGPIVRLQGPFGGDVVVLSRPEDALAVFASEGRYPIRSSLDCIEKYRLEYRRFKHAGPFLMFGEDWEKLRTQIVSSLSNSASYQFQKIDFASTNFVLRIRDIVNRQDEVPRNFNEEIEKWSLECLCSVFLGQSLGFMAQKESITTSESARIFKAFHGATSAIRRCESGLHLWKFVQTPAWKALVKHCDTIDSILGKYLQEAETNLQDNKQESFSSLFAKNNITLLQAMLLQQDLYPEDILTVILDMMLIGVNATTHSVAFLFYHLARCPRAQRMLADEIRFAGDLLDAQDIGKLKYLQACIKESLRLKPPIPFLSRILTRDIVVHNYRIPKGTVVLMATYLSSTREENFDDALKFIPERWMAPDMSSDSSLACIPFGYGPKACLARSFAETQLSVLLLKMIRNYKIEYHYGDIKSTNNLLAYPDKPLKFRFLSRTA